ncbi:HN1_G0015970.mRNA.1.CDS.1 [Saccharomyces cerevisiae]|nr:HN1_G0015970.mRNA.1.CDS.1 [Saccharomyces cerevisiae]CAI4273134.1 BAL_1a_G0003730.mRNA.1.CDS.1 [Saccharomyces cerevisiae]CAI7047882.1 BAL_1a_G0003730.mRNA.1.CDS.1 [Saccharomyces cerevisiae]
MPSLRDLSLERNQELNQLRARINQLSKTGKKEAYNFVGSNISNEPVYDTVIQTGQSSNATNSFVQETIQKTKQKESGQPYIIPQKNEHQRNIDKICETSDLKAKLAPIMEVLEKKTNEKIKGIIRKRVLQEPDRDNDDSG